eukprot:ctg_5474.g646
MRPRPRRAAPATDPARAASVLAALAAAPAR